MDYSAFLQNILAEVGPVFKFGQTGESRSLEVFVLFYQFDFFLVFLIDLVNALGDQLRGERDPGNLGSEQMFFFACKMRVHDYLFFQVAREEVLYLFGCSEVFRVGQGQFGPFPQQVRGTEVSELVHSCPPRFHVPWQFPILP